MTRLPEKGGLYCADIFGPVAWKAGEFGLAMDDRSERWGHIAVPDAMSFRHGGAFDVLMIVPPTYRRFVAQTAELRRADARKRRAELTTLAASEAWPYADSLDRVLAEEGLPDSGQDASLIDALGDGVVEPGLNSAYRVVVNRSNTLRRLSELRAPRKVLADARDALRAAVLNVEVAVDAATLPEAVRRLALGET